MTANATPTPAAEPTGSDANDSSPGEASAKACRPAQGTTMEKLRSGSTFSRIKPEQRRSLETWIFDDSLVYKETQARVLVEFGLECSIPSLERFHQQLRRGKCDGVVTGCNGKCYGLNIRKLLRINMCDGVTAWGGERHHVISSLAGFADRRGRQWAAREGACASHPRLLSVIIGYYPVVIGRVAACAAIWWILFLGSKEPG